MKLYGHKLDEAAGKPVREVVAVMDRSADLLIRRAAHLDLPDRRLIVTALTTRLSQRRLAELFGQPFGTVSRRLKRIGKLLAEPHIVQLLEGPCPLDPTDRQIAIGFFVRRQSIKQLAKQHDMKPPQVAKRIEYFKGWMKGVSGRK